MRVENPLKFETQFARLFVHFPIQIMSVQVEMNTSDPITLVSTVLGLRQKARTAHPTIQEKVRGLQGLLDSTKPQTVDWRNGGGGGGSAPHRDDDTRFRSQHNHNRGPEPRNRFDNRDRERDREREGGGHNSFRNGGGHNNFRNQHHGGGGMHRNNSASTFSSNGSNESKTPIGSPVAVVTSPRPPVKYQSRFKNSTQDIEEKILNRVIRLKLNKFGQSTYNDIREFLFQILGDETDDKVADFVKDFMSLVFSKAAAEEIYCPLYALLLSEIGKKHKIIFEEMNLLLKNYLEIFEDIDEKKQLDDTATFEKHNIEKKYRLGYSQFLAELTALKVIPVDNLATVFQTVIGLIDKYSRIEEKRMLVEEYVDCLKRMTKTLDAPSAKYFHKQMKEKLDAFINIRDSTYPSLTSKARFILMDILDVLSK